MTALVRDQRSRDVLTLAVRGSLVSSRGELVVFCRTWDDLMAQVLTIPPRIVLFDDASSGLSLSSIRDLRRALPRGALVAWVVDGVHDHRFLANLVAGGVDGLYLAGERPIEAGRLAQILDEAMVSSLTASVLERLRDIVPATLVPFVRALLQATPRPVQVETAARINFSTARTLRRHLERSGLPGPGRLIVWCRLFHAAHLLENPRRSVLNVVVVLDFPSLSGFRNQLKRYAGLTPTEVRAGGLDLLLDQFDQCFRDGDWGLLEIDDPSSSV